MTTLTEIRARVRTDLHDEDAAGFRWASAELDRHIFHALREMSLALPVEDKATLGVTAGSRDIDLSSLTGLVLVESVEYPAGQSPPAFTEFRVWGDTLTLLVERVPAEGEQAVVYYGKLHTLDYLSSTVPQPLEDILVTGALGYAAHSMSGFTINRLNTGGDSVWRDYMTWGRERFERLLSGSGEAWAAPTDEVAPPEPTPGGAQRRTKWCCSSRDRQCMSSLKSTAPENS